MNRSDFINMMESTVPFDRHLVSEINELIDIFPYFQSAHLLLLRLLQNNDDVKFSNQLRNSAIHIADREVLYHLLQMTRQKVEIPPNHTQEPPVEVSLEKDPERPVEILTDQNQEQPVEVSSEMDQEQPVKVQNQEQPVEALPNQTLEQPVEVSPNQTQEQPVEMPVYQYQERPVDVSPDQDHEQTVIESANNSDELINEIEKETFDSEQIADPESDKEEQAGIMILSDEESSFDDFGTGNKAAVMDSSVSDGLLELDQEIVRNNNDSEAASEKNEAEESDLKKLQSDLIDKFIIANPRIEPNREKRDEPINEPPVSDPEEGGFVTETLAKIYIRQGYYSKAIDIFEKLSLKFPEKSSYFATQIEKVKEYLKN